MNRKQRRAQKRALQKQEGDSEAIDEKMVLFGKLPAECAACTGAFDKNDRDMVMSWNVIVREKEEIVRLYCPSCWEAAQKAVKQVYGELDDII